MSETKKNPQIKFARNDGIISKGSDFSNSIVKKYIHKQVIKKIGDGEDDFIIIEKPTLIEEYDLHKSIQVEAEKNNLKTLLAEVLRTGDESLLHQKDKPFGNIVNAPTDIIESKKMADKAKDILNKLPKELKGKDIDEILNMSQEDILKAYGINIPKSEDKNGLPVPTPEPNEPKKDGD